MKKKFLSYAVAVMLTLGGIVSVAQANTVSQAQPVTLQDVAKNLPFPMNGVKIVKETPIGNGLYEIVFSLPKNQGMPYTIGYGNQNYIIMGNMFKNKQNVTQMAMGNYLKPYFQEKIKNAGVYAKQHASQLNAVSVAFYTPKKPNGQTMYIFTDTQCPACQEAKKNFIQMADQTGYTLKLIPMAEHPKSIEYWNGFICGHATFKDYVDGNYKPTTQCNATMNFVGPASQLAQRMGIFATPTFVTTTGQTIVGYNPAQFKQLK